MDKFSYTIFLKNIRDNQTAITLEYFKEALLTLSPEDCEEIFEALTARETRTVEDGKQSIEMLSLLWHYR